MKNLVTSVTSTKHHVNRNKWWFTGLFICLITSQLVACIPALLTGTAGGIITTFDRRTYGAQAEDEALEWKVNKKIKELGEMSADIDVVSYNRRVLLVGQVANKEFMDIIGKAAAEIINVREIVNHIRSGGASNLIAASADASVTAQVKARLLTTPDISTNHIKVLTKNNIVYLLGIVTPREATIAAHTASTTSGVSKVVTVFENFDQYPTPKLNQVEGQPPNAVTVGEKFTPVAAQPSIKTTAPVQLESTRNKYQKVIIQPITDDN